MKRGLGAFITLIAAFAGCWALSTVLYTDSEATDNPQSPEPSDLARAAKKNEIRQPQIGEMDLGNEGWVTPPQAIAGFPVTLEYPSMVPTAWPGVIGLHEQHKAGRDDAFSENFPVYVMQVIYEPYGLDAMPSLSLRRPEQMRWDLPVDALRKSSGFEGLDSLTSARVEATLKRRGEASTDSKVYSAAEGLPYDLLVRCSTSDCEAEIYSVRTGLRFSLRYPAPGVSHTVDLLRKLDDLILSWAPKDGTIQKHYLMQPVDAVFREKNFPTPPPCTSPTYKRLILPSPPDSLDYIAVDSDDNIYTLTTELFGDFAQNLYVLARGGPMQKEAKQRLFAGNVGRINGLSVEGDYIYVSDREIKRSKLRGVTAGHFSSYTKPSAAPLAIAFGPDGALVAVDFQNGRLQRIEKPGTTASQARIVATGINRANDVAVGRYGTIYVTNGWLGVINTVSSDGVKAELPIALRNPEGISIDGQGNIFVADRSAASIKKITPQNTVCAVANDEEYSIVRVGRNNHLFAMGRTLNRLVEFIPQAN